MRARSKARILALADTVRKVQRVTAATSKSLKVVKEKRKTLDPGERRLMRAEVMAAHAEIAVQSVAPQLHRKRNSHSRPNGRRSIKNQDSAEEKMVGGTGIEPVTPTISTRSGIMRRPSLISRVVRI